MKKAIGLATVLFLLASMSVAAYGYYKYQNMVEEWYKPLDPPSRKEASAGEPVRKARDAAEEEKEKEKVTMEPFNMMILGVDSRGESKSRSDTMMLAAVNPMNQKVTLLSIPRDTLAYIPGHGRDKFNHSMFYGGPPLVKDTMERFFGIKIDHYVTVDFDGFVKLVDTLGGVDVNVKRRMKYHDPSDGTRIDLFPGEQHLDGKNALDYARFRKSDIGSDASDFDRMERQQEVVRSLAGKATEIQSLFRIFSLMEILGEHVKMDFTKGEVSKLALLFKDFSSDSIQTVEVKGTNKRIPMHGYNLWFYLVSDEEKKRIREAINETHLESGEGDMETARAPRHHR